jgi:hypothetical protein
MTEVQHWAVTHRETGEQHFVERPIGEHPSGSGYGPKSEWRYVKIGRAPAEDDRFDGKRLVKCEKRARELRHHRRTRHHPMTRGDV